MQSFPFSRVLVVNDSSNPGLGLLTDALSLASHSPQGEVLAAVTDITNCMEAEYAPWTYRVLPDLSVDSVFEAATRFRCDLILARPPANTWAGSSWLRGLLFESPCPVCLIPAGARLSLERALVRLSLTPRGSRLLSLAAGLIRAVGGEELVAVHNVFDYDVDEHPDLSEDLRTRDELAIYRFLARTDLSGVNVSPIRESRPGEARTLLGVARRRGARLLVIDPGNDGGPVWQWNRREVLNLAMHSDIAVISTGLSNQDRGWRQILRQRVFTEREPKFN
jgi:hypothetical protein